MGNKTLIFSIAVMIVVAAGFFGFEQSKNSQKLPVSGPDNFNLIFKYGVGAKNELDTFEQTYTKDMVLDPPVTIKFALSSSELTEIYQKINDLNLFDKGPEQPKGNVFVTPCSNYYLKAYIDSTNKEIYWNNCRGKVSVQLEEFSSFVISIIEAKAEYKKLPIPKSGYL
jgi:hypothetical protein